MTNHIHGIIILNEIPVGAGFTPAKNDMYNGITNNAATDNRVTDNWETDNWATNNRATARVAPTVSDIVGAYKSLAVNESTKETTDKKSLKLFVRKVNYFKFVKK